MNSLNILTRKLKVMNFAMNIKTIEHNGVIFPDIPEYVTDNNFKLEGEKIPELAKEMLFSYCCSTPEHYLSDKTFRENAWYCIQQELTRKQQKLSFPADFKQLFKQMKKIYEAWKNDIERKREVKERNAKLKELYGTVYINGKPCETSFRIEPPRFYAGRGDGQTRGLWVYRVEPEDVFLNSSKRIKPPKGHKWAGCEVRNILGIATYHEHLGPDGLILNKTVMLSSKSEGKQEHDMAKFEKARLIQKHWTLIEKKINDAMSQSDSWSQQIGCAAYLIKTFGIRAGNDSGSRANGVVGASTLLVKNIDFLDKNTIRLHFLGKDSIEYDHTQKIDPLAYKVLEKLARRKAKNSQIFDEISSGDLNWFFKNISKKLGPITNKNFRTYYGTSLLAKEIQDRDWSSDMSDRQFVNQYNDCVLVVARKLNHQKTVTEERALKIDESTKLKLEKLEEQHEKHMDKLESELEDLNDELNQLRKEKSKGYLKRITEIKDIIKELQEAKDDEILNYEQTKYELQYKMDNKEVALGTSKSNYSDPKIAYSLCKYCDKDPKSILSKALVERFNTWIDINKIDEKYWMNYPDVD